MSYTIDDTELARRSVQGFGEMVAALGQGISAETVVRRANALGARIEAAAHNPWFDAAIIPVGATPPDDDPRLPHCLWTLVDAVPGRVELPEIATPCMGIRLDSTFKTGTGNNLIIESPSLTELGEINERAYGETGFTPLVSALSDARVHTHGFRENGTFVSVALTLSVGDDLSIHYVATEAGHRRRGLASQLVYGILTAAQEEGMLSATLQASADGLPVWQRLGFRRVAMLRGYLRPDATID